MASFFWIRLNKLYARNIICNTNHFGAWENKMQKNEIEHSSRCDSKRSFILNSRIQCITLTFCRPFTAPTSVYDSTRYSISTLSWLGISITIFKPCKWSTFGLLAANSRYFCLVFAPNQHMIVVDLCVCLYVWKCFFNSKFHSQCNQHSHKMLWSKQKPSVTSAHIFNRMNYNYRCCAFVLTNWRNKNVIIRCEH